MACLGLRTTGGLPAQRLNHRFEPVVHPPNRVAMPRCQPAKMGMIQCSLAHETQLKSTKFDRWINDSVVEIVKNLREAPLFVHVYGGGGPETKLKTERAVADEWAHMKGKWVNGEEPSPEGIILVEELKEIDDENVENIEESEGQNRDSTKAFGVLIQGKGDDGGVACYLLKTSKVGCGNLGLFCTHYCLVRVKSFRQTAKSQLTSCWLV